MDPKDYYGGVLASSTFTGFNKLLSETSTDKQVVPPAAPEQPADPACTPLCVEPLHVKNIGILEGIPPSTEPYSPSVDDKQYSIDVSPHLLLRYCPACFGFSVTL